jgi:hypothetical protein
MSTIADWSFLERMHIGWAKWRERCVEAGNNVRRRWHIEGAVDEAEDERMGRVADGAAKGSAWSMKSEIKFPRTRPGPFEIARHLPRSYAAWERGEIFTMLDATRPKVRGRPLRKSQSRWTRTPRYFLYFYPAPPSSCFRYSLPKPRWCCLHSPWAIFVCHLFFCLHSQILLPGILHQHLSAHDSFVASPSADISFSLFESQSNF